MANTHQQARLLQAADRDARNTFPLLEKRSFQVGLAKGLLGQVLSAAEAPEDIREQAMNLAIALIRRELGANGRLSNG